MCGLVWTRDPATDKFRKSLRKGRGLQGDFRGPSGGLLGTFKKILRKVGGLQGTFRGPLRKS
jgi:hypothetical protein